jgi:hypothetical protein
MYSDPTSLSGRELKNELHISGGTSDPDARIDRMIRWGNSSRIRFSPTMSLNKREALENSTNKRRALEILGGVNLHGAPLVSSFTGDLLVARKDTHQAGSDFYLVASQEDFALTQHLGCTHYTTFIPCKREYRLHIFLGEVIGIAEKRMGDQCKSLTIRNFHNGWTFKYIDNCDEQFKTVAKNAVTALGLDFAAIDLMQSVKGNIYVLEANSAPALVVKREDNTLDRVPMFDKYISKFRTWLQV